MKKNLMIKVLSVLLFFAFITACSSEHKFENKSAVKKVKAEKVVKRTIPSTIELTGNIEGVQKAKISTKLMGNIIYFPYEVGDFVKKGDIIVKVKSGDLEAKREQIRANLIKAKAGLRNVEINYNRVKELYELKSATKKEFEDIEMHYKMAQADLKAVKEMEKEINDVLSYANIKAPFDGYVVNKFNQEGDIALPGYPLLILENHDKFKIVTSVPSSDVNNLKKDQEVNIRIPELDNLQLKGKIKDISAGGNPASREFQVNIELEANNSLLRSGMYAKVSVDGASKQIITINKNYLINRGQLKGVFTVNSNNEASLRWLRLGEDFGEEVEVVSGLNENDVLIISKEIKEGQRVEVL